MFYSYITFFGTPFKMYLGILKTFGFSSFRKGVSGYLWRFLRVIFNKTFFSIAGRTHDNLRIFGTNRVIQEAGVTTQRERFARIIG